LVEKAGFGIAGFGHRIACLGHDPLKRSARIRCGTIGNIMPERIDSKRAGCLSMNYNA
jgi:hypothetical protein